MLSDACCSGLFLPSLATVKGVNADAIPTGGVGGGKGAADRLNSHLHPSVIPSFSPRPLLEANS